jgi:Predicted transcriptional regulator
MTENNLVGETALIVRAFVAHNLVRADDLPKLIKDTHAALQALQGPPVPVEEPRPAPAVPVRKSVHPDQIICLECGLSFKAIKRHLDGAHGFTPEQYRERWDLPRDYPMVAPSYSEARSQLAKKSGLGRKPKA